MIFILEKKSGKEIENILNLNRKFVRIPNYATRLKILKIFRQVFAEYIKYSYKMTRIGGSPEKDRLLG